MEELIRLVVEAHKLKLDNSQLAIVCDILETFFNGNELLLANSDYSLKTKWNFIEHYLIGEFMSRLGSIEYHVADDLSTELTWAILLATEHSIDSLDRVHSLARLFLI